MLGRVLGGAGFAFEGLGAGGMVGVGSVGGQLPGGYGFLRVGHDYGFSYSMGERGWLGWIGLGC